MAVIEDPIVYVPAGVFSPKAHYKVYKGKLPSTAGYLSEGQAQTDGSVSGRAVGVAFGTEICVVGQTDDGKKATVVGEAGKPIESGSNTLDTTHAAPSGMNILDWETPSELREEKTVKELREEAKELGLTGTGKLGKDKLATAVSQGERKEAKAGKN